MNLKKYIGLVISLFAIIGCAKGSLKNENASKSSQSFLEEAAGNVFISLCPNFGDSIFIYHDSMKLFERGGNYGIVTPLEDALGDTLFYGVFSFVGKYRNTDTAKYFFGYTHRGGRETWDNAMFLPFVSKKKWMPGTRGNFTELDFRFCEAD